MKKRILISILLIILAIIFIFIGVKFLELIHFKCIFKEIFNIYCAGCGTTRMFESIFKLDFYQAFRYNPLIFILSLFAFLYLILNIILYITNKPLVKISYKTLFILALILLIYMALRNIPYFEYLRPTIIK